MQRWGHEEKSKEPLSQIHNKDEAEEGRKRDELAECVWSGDKEDELERHDMPRLIPVAESEAKLFTV